MQEPGIVVVLDNIRSVYNVGSIFRTSDALGVAKVYLCGITPTPDHPRMSPSQERDSFHNEPDKYGRTFSVAKTALAGLHSVAWEHTPSTLETVTHLKKSGYTVIAVEITDTSQPIHPISSRPLAIVLGNEKEGINQEILALADEILHIPMHGVGKSLNVSVSYGIAGYELLRQSSNPQ
ncbi:MAG TPA: RNA methyltransferase [Patescibacteria group bacterium]